MKVFALTFGRPTNASSFYRVYQYIEPLRAEGIHLECAEARSFSNWQTLAGYDLVLLQKQLLGWRKFALLRKFSRCLAYDLDDAIWLPQKGGHHFVTQLRLWIRIRKQLRTVQLCIAANEVLAAHSRRLGAARVELLPMALPAEKWEQPPSKSIGKKVVIGWSGAPTNLAYLEALEPALGQVLQKFPHAELQVYCGKEPSFRKFPFRHFPFQPGTEPGVVRGFDIGLLPLPTDSFASAKSPIKALQYFASGVPAVATPVGATRELVRPNLNGLWAEDQDQWVQALSNLIENAELRIDLGRQARRFFDQNHTTTQLAPKFANILRTCVSTKTA